VGDLNSYEVGYVAVDQHFQPSPAMPISISASISLAAEADQNSCGAGQKRKASSPQRLCKVSRTRRQAREYWKWDADEGRYFHSHSDGKVTWLEESDDDHRRDYSKGSSDWKCEIKQKSQVY
jgi:hypothetical protein